MEAVSEGAEGIILESVLEGYAECYSADLSELIYCFLGVSISKLTLVNVFDSSLYLYTAVTLPT